MISPKENFLLIIYPGTDCCRWFSVAYRTVFWCDFCEVKGEGCILNFILYSFFRVFPIFDPRVFFRFLPLPFTRIYIKEFSNLHPYLFGDSFDGQGVTGEGRWRHFFAFFKHFFAFWHFKESLVGNGELWTCLGKEKGEHKKAR